MSVDFSPFVNLRIYDKDPAEIYLTALDLLQLNVPQLTVRPGTIEDGLLQAFSFISTIAINHINAIPNRLVEGMANLIGVARRNGTYAVIPVTITAIDYAGGTLEAGTTFEYTFQSGGNAFREYYELPSAVTIEPVEPDLNANPPTPLPTIDVNLTALEIGERRTIPEDAVLTILNSQTVSDSAVAKSGFIQGTTEESDAEFLARFATFLQSMTITSSTAKQIEAYAISNYSFISRAKAFDLTNSLSNRLVGAADVPGYTSLFLYGNGRELSDFEKIKVYEEMSERVLAGLLLIVDDMKILPVTITATVKIAEGSDFVSTKNAIETVLSSYFSPVSFPGTDPAIRKNAVLGQINSVPNVAYVTSLTITCDDSTTTGTGDLVFNNKGSLPLLELDDITLTLDYL